MAKSIEHLEEEIQRLNQELSILSTIGRTVNQSVDLYEILNNGLDRIREMTLVSRAGCYLVEESQKDLVLAAQRGCSKSFTQRFRRRPLGDGGLTGKVALTGEPLYVEDYASHPEALPLAVEEGVKSLVIIPLKSTAKIFGTLNIEWQEPHCFTPQEKNLFNSIGQIISSALERAFLYTENVRRLEEQKTLHSISQEIASRLELKIILQKIMESAVELLGSKPGKSTSGTIASKTTSASLSTDCRSPWWGGRSLMSGEGSSPRSVPRKRRSSMRTMKMIQTVGGSWTPITLKGSWEFPSS